MKRQAYRTERIPPVRRFSIDEGYLGRRRHIVDGAPAARFAQTFRSLLKTAYGLTDIAGLGSGPIS